MEMVGMKQLIDDLFAAAQADDVVRLHDMLESQPQLANAENSEGLMPLGYAAHFGNADAVRVLLEYGAEVNAISRSKVPYIPSNTALHAAIAGSRSEAVVKLLLSHQAQTTLFDSNGHTCLHTAAFHDDNVDIIRMLIAHGADVNAKAEGGETALSLAVKQGNERVAAFLREHGAM
ncbi:ankyrin repeat domain-containing protein [Paenibacillus marinisediminis]